MIFLHLFQIAAALGLVAASWWLVRRRRSWARVAVPLLLLVLAAPLLILLGGVISGCAFRPTGERCYWYGFGLTVALLLIVPVSLVMTAIGALIAVRWPRRG